MLILHRLCIEKIHSPEAPRRLSSEKHSFNQNWVIFCLLSFLWCATIAIPKLMWWITFGSLGCAHNDHKQTRKHWTLSAINWCPRWHCYKKYILWSRAPRQNRLKLRSRCCHRRTCSHVLVLRRCVSSLGPYIRLNSPFLALFFDYYDAGICLGCAQCSSNTVLNTHQSDCELLFKKFGSNHDAGKSTDTSLEMAGGRVAVPLYYRPTIHCPERVIILMKLISHILLL